MLWILPFATSVSHAFLRFKHRSIQTMSVDCDFRFFFAVVNEFKCCFKFTVYNVNLSFFALNTHLNNKVNEANDWSSLVCGQGKLLNTYAGTLFAAAKIITTQTLEFICTLQISHWVLMLKTQPAVLVSREPRHLMCPSSQMVLILRKRSWVVALLGYHVPDVTLRTTSGQAAVDIRPHFSPTDLTHRAHVCPTQDADLSQD